MTISTYDGLISAAADWMARNNINSARANDFVSLAEAHFNRKLRVTSMEVRAAASIEAGDAYLSMPSTSLGLKILTHDDDRGGDLDFATASWLRAHYRKVNGRPAHYAQFGTEWQLGPIPDANYTFEAIYYERIPALSAGAPTNWLLAKHPDIYLAGTLTECALFYQNDALLARWQPLRDQKMDDLITSEDAVAFNASPLQTRVS